MTFRLSKYRKLFPTTTLYRRTPAMATSPLLAYEHLLCEEEEGEDKWWFLRSVAAAGHANSSGPVLGSAVEDVGSSELSSTVPVLGGHEGVPVDEERRLGKRETAMVDILCSKYTLGRDFRKDLLSFVILLLSLQAVEVVNANGEEITKSDVHSVMNCFDLLSSLNCFCVILLTSLLAFFMFERIREALGSVLEYFGTLPAELNRRLRGEEVNETVLWQGLPRRQFSDRSLERRASIVADSNGYGSEEMTEPLDEDAYGLWSEWYENLAEELDHNLQCWSPR